MFNLKKMAVKTQEKYLRDNTLGPSDNKGDQIVEKKMPHHSGDSEVIIQSKLEDKSANNDSPIIEKVLNDTKGKYVDHRNVKILPVPPMSDLVERIRQKRLSTDWKPTKESNWTVTFDDQKQNGDLPAWPKSPDQHDKIVLNNDPRRFSGEEIKPLTGHITTADIDNVVCKIKMGASIDYDSAIVAILRDADRDERELTSVERKTINDLKVARTQTLLKHV